MRWRSGISYSGTRPPTVLIVYPANPGPREIKIDFRGLGVYLTIEEAAELAVDLREAVTDGEPSE